MTVVDGLNGKSKVIIPQSAFPKEGQWRVKATVKVTDTLDVIDDVNFTLVKNLTFLRKEQAKQLTVKPSLVKPLQQKLAVIPMIVFPRENQRVAAPGTLSVKARWKVGDFSLFWEVAHKPFGKSRFTPHTLKPTAYPSTTNTAYSGKLKLPYPGYYRLRVKTDSAGSTLVKMANDCCGGTVTGQTFHGEVHAAKETSPASNVDLTTKNVNGWRHHPKNVDNAPVEACTR